MTKDKIELEQFLEVNYEEYETLGPGELDTLMQILSQSNALELSSYDGKVIFKFLKKKKE